MDRRAANRPKRSAVACARLTARRGCLSWPAGKGARPKKTGLQAERLLAISEAAFCLVVLVSERKQVGADSVDTVMPSGGSASGHGCHITHALQTPPAALSLRCSSIFSAHHRDSFWIGRSQTGSLRREGGRDDRGGGCPCGMHEGSTTAMTGSSRRPSAAPGPAPGAPPGIDCRAYSGCRPDQLRWRGGDRRSGDGGSC